MPVDGSEAVVVANGGGDDRLARFSPDGRWVAYESNESGRPEVYVVSADGKGTTRQVSTEGGTSPVWSTEGRSLYHLQNGYLVAQEVRLGTDFTVGRATRLLATPAVNVDVVPGKGFVLTEPNTAPPDGPLYLIVNWFEELKAKVPVK
jgi:Tol biopolymer transport system component